MGHDKLSIPLDQLMLGATCSQPIVSDTGVLLLAANTRITQQVVTGLRERGFDSIDVDPLDLALSRVDRSKRSVQQGDRNKIVQWTSSKPVKDMLVDRYSEALSEERAAFLTNRMMLAKKHFDALRIQLTTDPIRSLSDFISLSDSFGRALVDDHDQTVGTMATPLAPDADADRAVRMSVLGMSIAIELGLDGIQTMDVGMAGLLQDIGLYAMDAALSDPVELMSSSQRWEYRKHPLVAAKCVSNVLDVPHHVLIAIEQVHEQFDGSGYPRGIKLQRIHLYARILNVVDAFLQLTSATSQRSPIIAHDAISVLLHQAARGTFDPQVIRAFLNVESLFPLGSHVELSTGQIAKVIRRPRNGFATPVVQADDGTRIELENSDIRVVRPQPDPDQKQIRISQHAMLTCDWNPAQDSLTV